MAPRAQAGRPRPGLALLFDELLSQRVAKALRALGVRASPIGPAGGPSPPRGAADDVVLEHASRTGQVLVTSNHDMILLCAEQQVSVIWIDPRGRALTLTELVPLVFNGMADWERLLDGAEVPGCVHVLRTRAEALPLAAAAQRVRRRLRVRTARPRRSPPRRPANLREIGPL